MDGITSRARTVNGVPTSLLDLGYSDVGLDDAWQVCGENGMLKYTYHDTAGNPIVDENLFPDMKAMNDYAHDKGLTTGWYGNNCICKDHCMTDSCYENDVKALVDFGFDGVKLDNCGKQLDLQKWSDLMDAASPDKPLMIENCHWGLTTPTADGWCPFNFYRSSMDVRASYDSVIANLMSTSSFAAANLSYPGCWAYPDGLEIGIKDGPGGANDPGLTFNEARTHFGGWCIVSSPLVLEFDTTDDVVVDEIWPIVSNSEAIAVNQAYAGESGALFASSTEKVLLNLWTRDDSAHAQANVSDAEVIAANPLGGIFSDNINNLSFKKEILVGSWQQWSKLLDDKSAAVLVINNGDAAQEVVVDFASIPSLKRMGGESNSSCGKYYMRDIWAHNDLPAISSGSWMVQLDSHDSAFVLLTSTCV